MGRFVVDSWAWVEYLRGSKLGQTVKREIEGDSELLTHVVTLAELFSKFKREGLDLNAAWKALTTLSRILTIRPDDAKEAGILHAIVKQKRPNFSLADSFIL